MNIIVLVAWPIFFILSFFLARKAHLNIKSKTYSDLGTDNTYGPVFNTALVAVGTLQLIFLTEVFIKNISYTNSVGTFGFMCLMITSIAGVITGLVSQKRNDLLHTSTGELGFVFSIIGYAMYGFSITSNHVLIGIIFMAWGLVVIPLQALPYSQGKEFGIKNEFYMFLGAFITDILLNFLYY